MIITLLIVMFIILVLVTAVFDKVVKLEKEIDAVRKYCFEIDEKNLKLFKRLHDTDVVQSKSIRVCENVVKQLTKNLIDDVEKIGKEIEVINVDRELKADMISMLNIEVENLKRYINYNNYNLDADVLSKAIDGLEEKTKSCSIDGKCE